MLKKLHEKPIELGELKLEIAKNNGEKVSASRPRIGLTTKQRLLIDMTADQPAAKIKKMSIQDYGTKIGPVSDEELDAFLKVIKSTHQFVKLVPFSEDNKIRISWIIQD